MLHEEVVEDQMVEERSQIGIQCGDDNQSTRKMVIATKGAIPSTAKEGGFVATNRRRNLGITTIENCEAK
jgi:hypothetical protein